MQWACYNSNGVYCIQVILHIELATQTIHPKTLYNITIGLLYTAICVAIHIPEMVYHVSHELGKDES